MNQHKTADVASRRRPLLRALLLLTFALFCYSPAAHAQPGTVIQPCPAEPSPNKREGLMLPTSSGVKSSGQTAVDDSIPPDAAVEKMIGPYSARVKELETVIGKLDGELAKGTIGAGSLGNFVTDGLRAQASRKLGQPVLVMITNSGGLRKNAIAAGDLRASDIFELLPFENALIQLELTGEQLTKLLETVLTRRDAQSGARITYRLNADKNPEVVSIKLVNAQGVEVAIDPKATYSIVTIDYLIGLRSGSYALLQEGKNAKPLGLTMRDAMMEYVKSETAAGRSIKPTLDGRFVEAKSSQAEAKPE